MADFPLLPSDRYIADLLGLSEEQYRFYVAEVRRRAAAGPQPSAVATIGPDFFLYVAVISSLLSVGLTIAASFFKPRPQAPPRLQQTQTQGQSITNVRRYAPRTGFDSVQDVANIGDPIPLVYARRELIDGQNYGGIRVNTPLIWNAISAIDKSQLLRALFLIGEGHPDFEIDPLNIAIGNNTLGSYLLGNTSNARFTVYYRPDGGRITSTDRIAGTSSDPGAATGNNVYGVVNAAGAIASDFSHAHRPNTQTQFGVYALIGNGLGFRVNPSLRPGVNAQITVDVKGKKKKAKAEGRVVCEPDLVALAQREKYRAKFSGRSGLIANSGTTWTYHLSNTTDALTVFSAGRAVTEWTSAIATFENPFPGVSDSAVTSWLSVGSITVASSTVSASVAFNTSAAEAGLAGVADGTYIIEYGIYLKQNDREVLWLTEEGSGYIVTATIVTTPEGRVYSFTGTGGTISIASNARDDDELHEERCGDVAAAVAGRQKTWDDAIQVGELYKLGSALAICTERSPSDTSFNSDADFEPISPSQGNAIEAKFEVIRSGSTAGVDLADLIKDAKSGPAFTTATNHPQVYRVAIANFSTLRECRIVRVCIRSSLGIRITGLCNFRDSLTYTEIDGKACYNKEGNKIPPGDYLTVDIFNSGQMSSAEERYSFFRIRYREAGTTDAYVDLGRCFGIRGITQQNVFNDIRLVMPSTKRWEFQLEPLSGWEIRSGTATGALELIDSSLTTERTISIGGVTVNFRGVLGPTGGAFIPAAQRSTLGPQRFMLTSVQRGEGQEVGIGYTDGNSYVDAWGKLAESFVYEEVRSSAESGPEHEIVSVDEIIPNPEVPDYANLALLGLNVRSGVEWQQFGQLSVYVLKGLAGGTHLFPEVLQDLLLNSRYGKGDQISAQQINTASFAAATSWCQQRRLFFDGAIAGKINLRQWAADVAAAHLLFFGESAGQFWLRPAWPGTVASPAPVSIKGIFTAGNMVENSFAMEFFEPEDRQPIQVSVKYREERLSSNLSSPGLFPVEREILVREAAPLASDTDPIESVDLSDYVTSAGHAIDAAKFIVRMRRVPDHAIKFTTTHEGIVAPIQAGDYIRVVLDFTHYDQLRNGAVLGNGALVSTQPFNDGTYTVLAWDGTATTAPAPTTLTVTGGGTTATPTGVVFTLVNTETQTRTYQIEKITPTTEGTFQIECVHMPTDSSGIPLIAKNWGGSSSDANWVIQA